MAMTPKDKNNTPTWQWVTCLAITILLLIAGASLSENRTDVKNTIVKQQATELRVATLEANYDNIIKGLDKLTATVEKNNDKLDTYRNEVKNKKTNMTDLKWK
jgi:peptidoglycan hydrolase CwlO-like protein